MLAACSRSLIRRDGLILVLAPALLMAAQARLGMALRATEPRAVEPHSASSVAWSPELFKVATFGHWPAGVDWLWIQALTDPDVSKVPRGQRASNYHDFNLASDLDPAFFDVYESGANYLAVIRDDGLSARDLLLKGEAFRKEALPGYSAEFRSRYWSAEWGIPLLLAYVYLFELDDIRSASRYFVEASKLPGSPPYLDRLSERLEKPGGVYEVGLRLLNFLITGSKDERTLENLEGKRAALQIAQFLDGINRAFRAYAEAHGGRRADPDRLWARFLAETATPRVDPFGGKLSLSPEGKVVSSTPRQRVFGLE